MQKPLLSVCLFESITSKSVICIGIKNGKKDDESCQTGHRNKEKNI